VIEITTLSPNDWTRRREMRLSALTEAPYAFCSLLGEWQDKEEQSWRDRLAEVSVNFIAELDGEDAGMVSAMTSEKEVELLAMWVAPFARAQGVGDELVSAVLQWSTSQGKPRVILRVLRGNDRAAALYWRHGFVYEPDEDAPSIESPLERLGSKTVLRIPIVRTDLFKAPKSHWNINAKGESAWRSLSRATRHRRY
jgi:ribosomal protein S18 acetylase RimI-like enzyme